MPVAIPIGSGRSVGVDERQQCEVIRCNLKSICSGSAGRLTCSAFAAKAPIDGSSLQSVVPSDPTIVRTVAGVQISCHWASRSELCPQSRQHRRRNVQPRMGGNRRRRTRNRNGAGCADSAIRIAGSCQMVNPRIGGMEGNCAGLINRAWVFADDRTAVRCPSHGFVVHSGNNGGYCLIAPAWGNRSFWIDIDALSQEWQ